MSRPRVIVFSGYGLNCEEETAFAFELAGAKPEIVNVNDVIDGRKKLPHYQILAFPGGFAYGDDTGSGNAYAQKLKNHLWEKLQQSISDGKLIIGICNGCQILVNLGVIPALNKSYGKREVALLHNDSARYIDRWVDLKNESDSPWLDSIDTFMAPIAHGEGKLYADAGTLRELRRKKLVALRYISGEICEYQKLPANPTGTTDDIAAITDETRRILGIMPHPERALFFTQLPHWPLLKETHLRNNKKLPMYGPGLQIFQNAVKYFN